MKYLKGFLSKFMIVIMLLSSFSGYGGGIMFASNDLTLTIQHLTDKTEPKTGESFKYTINYAISGEYQDNPNIDGLKIVEEVDPSLDFTIPDKNSDIQSITRSGNTITIQFKNNLLTGTSGVLPFSVWFKEGVTHHDETAVSTATFSKEGDPTRTVTANAPLVTAKADDITTIGVDKEANPAQPALDNFVYYTIKVDREPNIGGRNLENVTVTDTLPNGVTEVSAISPAGGVWNQNDNTITWSNQTITVGSAPAVYTLRCKYPSGTFNKLNNVINAAEVTGYHVGDDTQIDGDDNVTHHFYDASVGEFNIYKYNRSNLAVDEYSKDQTAVFTIGGVKNGGNVTVDSIRVMDIIPRNAMDVLSVNVGRYNFDDTNIKLFCTFDANLDYNNVDNANFTLLRDNIQQGANVPISTSGGAIVTSASAIKVLIEGNNGSKLPVGFAATSNIAVRGKITAEPDEITTYTNKIKSFIKATSEEKGSQSSANFKVKTIKPWYDLRLTSASSSYIDSEDIEYTLTLKNHTLSKGNLSNAVIGVQFIDERFDANDSSYQQISASDGVTALADINSTFGGNDVTYKRWKVNKVLEPNESVNIKFKNSFRETNNKLAAGSYDNLAFLVAEGTQDVNWEIDSSVNNVKDESDYGVLDDDGNTTDKIVTATCTIFNKFQGKINGKKYIKGETDNVYIDPTQSTTAHTLPSGYVSYKLNISNSNGNGPISDIVVVDKLPGVGDKGILSGSNRHSEWNPYLVGNAQIVDTPGVTENNLKIYYSTKDHPDFSILNNTTQPINAADWSMTPPDDIIDVTHILFKLVNYELQPAQEVNVEFKMIAPFGVPVNQQIHNSFAFGGTYPDSNAAGKSSFLPNEPPAVSHIIAAEGTDFGIGNRAFYDVNNNGLDDDMDTQGIKRGLNAIRFVLYKQNGGSYDRLRHTYSNKNADGEDGYYGFPKTLVAGNYKVLCLVPKSKELQISAINVGENIGTESNLDNDFELLANPDTYTFEAGLDKTKYDFYIYKNKSDSNVIGLTGANKDMFTENVSIGLYKYAKVSGIAFNDKNHNGIKDTGEPVLSGVSVSLNHSTYGNATDTTNAQGEYEFTDVIPATGYKLKVEAPNDEYAISQVGTSGTIKNEFTKNNTTPHISNEMNLDILSEDEIVKNAGMHRGIIEGLLWFDQNHDGLKNGSDPTLGGFTVKLYKNGEADLKGSVVTSSNGIYKFTDLVSGTYKLVIIPSTGASTKTFTATVKSNSGSYVKEESFVIVSGANANTIQPITLTKAGVTGNIGGGYYKKITLQGYIFNDTNLDGQFTDADDKSKFKDGADNPMDSLQLKISGGDLSGDLNVTATFDNTLKAYKYSQELNPSDNSYKIRYDNPNNTNFVSSPRPANHQVVVKTQNNKNVFVDNNSEVEFTLVSPLASSSNNDVNNTYYINGGLHKGLLKVKLYEDDNFDGNMVATETYFKTASANASDKDVIMQLLKKDGGGNYNVIETIYPTSMESTFRKLNNGDYKIAVKIKKSLDYNPTLNHGSVITDETISGTEYDVCTYPKFTITEGDKEPTFDIGFYRPAKVKSRVFFDKNYNGIRGAGESKIGVIDNVKLYDNANTAQYNFTADAAQELYTAVDIIPGTYKIGYAINQTGDSYYVTKRDIGDDTKDSDITVPNGVQNSVYSDNITLISGQVLENTDLGLYQKVKITGKLFREKGATPNGIKDGSDSYFSSAFNATVSVDDGTGNYTTLETKNISVSATGNYSFEVNPYPSAVRLTYGLPNDYLVSPKVNDANGNDVAENGVVSASIGTNTVNLISDQDLTFDYGLYESNSISGKVYLDKNGDDTQGAGEFPVSGADIIVHLLDGSGNPVNDSAGNPITTTVNANGEYSFDDLKFGTYKVKVTRPSYDDAITGGITVNIGDDITDQDIGIFQKVEIRGNVFEEIGTLLDGIKNNSDLDYNQTANGVISVTLNYSGGSTNTQNLSVAGDGSYSFKINPSSESLTLTYSLPTGFGISEIAATGNNVALNGTVSSFTPTSGDVKTFNYGLYQLSSISGTVYHDKDNDGNKEAGEEGIQATVTIYESDGTTIATDSSGNPITVTVAADGSYTIPNLPAGDYKIKVEEAGYEILTEDVTVSTNQDKNLDLGIYKKVEISGIVFKEIDTPNGIKDGSDTDYTGAITATFKDATDTVVETVNITVTNGIYSFKINPRNENLTLKYSIPDGYSVSPKKANQVNGSDIDQTGITFQPTSGVNQEINYGLYESNTVNGIIYHDLNANDTQEAGENAISATVTLYEPDGVTVATDSLGNNITTTVGADGVYTFNDVRVGDYIVKVERAGYETVTHSLTVTSNQTNTENLGIYKKVEIAGIVFVETGTPTGVKSAAEGAYDDSVIPIVATLKQDGEVDRTVTLSINATTGAYSFKEKPSTKDLEITYSLPDGYSISPKGGSTTHPNSNIDKNGVTFRPISGVNHEVNYGLYQSNSLSVKVYYDKDADGTKELGEDYITTSTSTVTLYKADGTTPATDSQGNQITVTQQADGSYKFDGIPVGTYVVRVENNANGFEPKDTNISLTSNQNLIEDIGIYKKVKISGNVFDEKYNEPNGQKDGADIDFTGTFNATLKRADDTVFVTVNNITVNANGEYEFYVNPSADTLNMTYSVPTNYSVSPVSSVAGGNDFNADNSGVSVTPTSGTDEEFDYGVYKTNKITGNIFHDKNVDGTQVAGEELITANTKIHLLNTDGSPVIGADNNPVIVDVKADGSYDIKGLDAGDYKLKAVNTVDGYEQVTSGVVAVIDGQTSTQDIGLYKNIQITGKVFEEKYYEPNGQKDGADIDFTGTFSATLKKADGTVVQTVNVNVNPNGTYEFYVSPNAQALTMTYSVPNGYNVSPVPVPNTPGANDFNSDNSGVTFTPTSGTPEVFDYGIYKNGKVTGSIFHDKNADGSQVAGEELITANTKIHLLNADGSPVIGADGNPVIVDIKADGTYDIKGLDAGDYKLKVVNTIDGYEQITSSVVTVVNGQTSPKDVGIYKKTSIFGKVFEDINRNGIDNAENGFSDIQIQVKSGSTNIGSPITPNADGSFTTIALKPDNYQLEIILPSGISYYRVSPKDIGNDDTIDSDIDPNTLKSDDITVVSGNTATSVKIGIYKLVTIQGKVEQYDETSGTNIPLQNATIHLLDASGNPVLDASGNAIVVTTDVNGNYSIPNLYPNVTYNLRVESSYDDNGNIVRYPDINKTVPNSNGGTVTMDFVSSKYVMNLSAQPEIIVGDGGSESDITFTINNQDGTPVANARVTFDASKDDAGNLIPMVKRGTFKNAPVATPYKIIVNTDAQGKAVATFKSADLRGYLETQKIKVKAIANLDNGKQLEDYIMMVLEPLSIKGTVKGSGANGKIYANTDIKIRKVINKTLADNDPRLMSDFKDGYKLSKITTGADAGKLLFEYTGRTDANGDYKIFVPYDGIDENTPETYDVEVIIPSNESPTNEELSFIQKGEVKKYSQSTSTSANDNVVDSNKTIVGTFVVKQDTPSGTGSGGSVLADPSKIVIQYKQGINTLNYKVNNKGVLVASAGNPKLTNAAYTREIYYTFSNGTRIMISSESFNAVTNGKLIVEDILVDPRGFVTDFNTGAPISGATVTLYDNATNAKVPLPANKLGFSNNANPQNTTAIGEYSWMVFPNTTYYIIAEAPGYNRYDSRVHGGELKYAGQVAYTPKAVGLIPVTNKIAYWNFKMRPIVKKSGSSSVVGGGFGLPVNKGLNTPIAKGLYQQEIVVKKRLTFAGENIELDLNYINKSAKTLYKGYLKVSLPDDLELIPNEGQFVKDGYIYIDVANLKPNEIKTVTINLSTDKVKKISDYTFESVLLDKTYNVISGLSHAMLRVYYVRDEKIFDGYMIGRPDGGFHPHDNITRAEVAAVLVRHTKNRYKTPEVTQYLDVNEGDWYYDILSEAIAYGYFTGYSDGTFKPNKYMTRGEIAEAIARFFKIDINSEDSITQFFTDVSGNKYEKQINLVARNRLMNGYPDKTFKPDSFTTRVEAAIFFDGLFNRYGTPNVEPSFFDVAKDFWAYGHIESVFRGFKIVNENGKIKVLSRKKVNPYYIKEEYGNK